MRSIGVPKGVFVTLAVLTYCSKNGRAKCRATKCVGPNEHCCCSEIGPFKNSRLVFRQAYTRRLANLRIQTIACVNGSNQKRLVAKPILDGSKIDELAISCDVRMKFSAKTAPPATSRPRPGPVCLPYSSHAD